MARTSKPGSGLHATTGRSGRGSQAGSEIVGTILLLAVTIAMMVSVFAYVMPGPPLEPPPQARLDFSVVPGPEGWGPRSALVVTHKGGEPVPTGSLRIDVIVDGKPIAYDGNSPEIKNHPAFADGRLVIGESWRSPNITINATSQVKAVVVAGSGIVSSGVVSKPPPPPSLLPRAPADLVGTHGDKRATLVWQKPLMPPPVSGYRVYRDGAMVRELPGENSLTWTDGPVPPLTNGQPYTYTVAAYNGVGEGPPSVAVTVTPAATPLGTVLTVTGRGNGTIDLGWLPAGDNGSPLTGYKLHRGTSPGNTTFFKDLPLGVTHRDAGLTNGVTYYYRIAAVNVNGVGALSNEANAKPAAAPGAPLLAGDRGNMQARLNWTVPAMNGEPVLGYTLYRSDSLGSPTVTIPLANITQHNDTGLVNGVTYTYQVTARNTMGEGNRSNLVNVVPAAVPDAPVLTATPGNRTVTLGWTTPNDQGVPILGYRVHRGTAPGNTTPYANVTPPANAFTDANLTNGVTYFYRVAAYNVLGNGSLSNEASAKPGSVPVAPVLAGLRGNRTVNLTWTLADNGGHTVLNYLIYRATVPGAAALVDTVGNASSWRDVNVTNGVSYTYNISAVNVLGSGASSNLVVMVPGAAPGAPVLQVLKGNVNVSMTWTTPVDNGLPITGYNLYRGVSGGALSLYRSLGVANGFLDLNVSNGLLYAYQVTAVNAGGEGNRSSEAAARPSTLPAAVQAFKASHNGNPNSKEIKLTWNPPTTDGGEPVTHYKIFRGTSPGNFNHNETRTEESLRSGLSYVWIDGGLVTGTTYYYRVVAINLNGEGPQSTEDSASG